MSAAGEDGAVAWEAVQRLSVIRATVCRALRAGAAPAELAALLRAEELAISDLAQAMGGGR